MDKLLDQIIHKFNEIPAVQLGGCKMVTSEKDELTKLCKIYRVELTVPYKNLSQTIDVEIAEPRKKHGRRLKNHFKIEDGEVSFK